MNLEEKCLNCRFFKSAVDDLNPVDYIIIGVCRYNPPIVNRSNDTIFPVVSGMGWCGKFEQNKILKNKEV